MDAREELMDRGFPQAAAFVAMCVRKDRRRVQFQLLVQGGGSPE